MRNDSSAISHRREAVGLTLGFVGVLTFSFTLPATKAAVPVFGGWTIGLGRAVVAGALAAVVLALRRSPVPPHRLAGRLALVAGGVVVGFPVLSALALEHVPASRGAVVIGVLPATTAMVATLRLGERPSRWFWLAATGGLATVLVFALSTGTGGRPEPADLLLLAAVAAAAVGYAEGAAVGRELGGWQTISWALVLALPVSLPVSAVALARHGVVEPTAGAVAGAVYVSLFSMFLGFFAWYAGLGMAGVARVSQLQLLQPVMTLLWAWLLLGEHIGVASMVAAVGVLGFVVASRLAPIATVPSGGGDRPPLEPLSQQ